MADLELTTVPRDLYYHEVAYVRGLEGALKSIRDAKEPPTNPAPDDRDWRDMALEMKRVATVSLSQASD